MRGQQVPDAFEVGVGLGVTYEKAEKPYHWDVVDRHNYVPRTDVSDPASNASRDNALSN